MKRKTVAILQSNYIPWKGYFDIISQVDEFIFHDDLQFTKQDWRNRNRIKTPHGVQWLTIPCGIDEHRKICDVLISNDTWQQKHWDSIYTSYHRAPYFKMYAPFLEHLYLHIRWHTLSSFNQYLIQYISREWLDLQTHFDDSRIYQLKEKKEKRVLELLTAVHATDFVSGPAAKSYIHEDLFEQHGITIHWMDYSKYKKYPQLYPPFEHTVSILDLLFQVGPKATQYIHSPLPHTTKSS